MRTLLFISVCFAVSISDSRASVQSIDAIRDLVSSFLVERTKGSPGKVLIDVGQIDRRLRLPACTAQLVPFLPQGGRLTGHITVGVRCPGERPWKLFVPATIDSFRNVVVLVQPARRGETLGKSHLRVEERHTGTLRGGYYVEPSPLIGTRTTRRLPVGTVLRPAYVAAAKVIRRGQRIILLASAGGLEVRMAGKALMDGAQGDLIRAENARSNRIVEGIVVASGVLRISM